MAAITALAVGSLLATGVGSYLNYRGAKEQQKTASNVSEYNAQLQEQEAMQIDMEARENLRRARRANKAFGSTQRAKVAASGVLMTGSPLENISENLGRLEIDALDRDRMARVAAQRAQSGANLTRMEGSSVASGYGKQATGSLLAGASNILGSGFGFYRQGAIG